MQLQLFWMHNISTYSYYGCSIWWTEKFKDFLGPNIIFFLYFFYKNTHEVHNSSNPFCHQGANQKTSQNQIGWFIILPSLQFLQGKSEPGILEALNYIVVHIIQKLRNWWMNQ